ncbi:MAG: hypothetical protein IT324_16120 [Anaerolineae bacterium]|nr:hypothetical protein [Anaerolineae bacterium]
MIHHRLEQPTVTSGLLQRSRRVYALVYGLYTLLIVFVMWNLLTKLTTHVPGGHDADYYQFLWNYWWIGFALRNGQSPLWSNYVLFPHVNNMSLHTLAAFWYPFYELFDPLVGRKGAGNLMVLLSFLFTGFAMFAWLRRRLGTTGTATIVAFIGGLAFMLSPYMMVHSTYTQLNLIGLWWFPLILWLWDEIAMPRHLPRIVTTVLMGVSLWGLWLTDLEFLLWIPITVGGYSLWTLWHARRNRQWLRLIGYALVAIAIMLALAWVYPLNALLQVKWDPNQFPPAGIGTLRAFSLPLSALIGLAEPVEIRWLGHVLVALFWVVIALYAVVRWRRTSPPSPLSARREGETLTPDPSPPGRGETVNAPLWLWLVLILPPLIMALGPDVTIGGITIPLPYGPLHDLFNGQHRSPSRFTNGATAMIITFLAVAWLPWFDRLVRSRRTLAGVSAVAVAALFMADVGAFKPYPAIPVADYPIYHQIAQDKRPFVIMDLPVGVQYGWTGLGRNGQQGGHYAMFYGPDHKHPMVNGWISRVPYSTLDYYLRSPLFTWLAGARPRNPDEDGGLTWELDKYLREWPLGYVVAHMDWMYPEERLDWIGWLNTQPGLCPAQMQADGALVWWRAKSLGCDADFTTQITLGTTTDWVYTGAGWYQQETVGGPAARWAKEQATLRVTVKPQTDYELTFTALPFGEGRTVTLRSGSWTSDPIAIHSGDWQTYKVTIPADALANSLLTLKHNGADSPAQRGQGDDPRMLAAAYGVFTLTPR